MTMKTDAPQISVIMAAKNAETTIAESIESVLQQTYPNWELIVVDDHSTDSTAKIAESYLDSRIRVIRTDRQINAAHSRNFGIQHSRSEFIAILDSDDLSRSDRFSKLLRYLEENPHVGLVASLANLIDRRGHPLPGGINPWMYCYDGAYRCVPLFENPFAHSSVVFRRSAIAKAPYDESFVAAHDFDLIARVCQKHDIGVVLEPLIRYRVHGSGVTGTQKATQSANARKTVIAQLRFMGLDPSHMELEIHFRAAGWGHDPGNPPISESAVRQWLQKLLNANEKSNRFDPLQLRKCVAVIWTRFCLRNRSLGFFRPGTMSIWNLEFTQVMKTIQQRIRT